MLTRKISTPTFLVTAAFLNFVQEFEAWLCSCLLMSPPASPQASPHHTRSFSLFPSPSSLLFPCGRAPLQSLSCDQHLAHCCIRAPDSDCLSSSLPIAPCIPEVIWSPASCLSQLSLVWAPQSVISQVLLPDPTSKMLNFFPVSTFRAYPLIYYCIPRIQHTVSTYQVLGYWLNKKRKNTEANFLKNHGSFQYISRVTIKQFLLMLVLHQCSVAPCYRHGAAQIRFEWQWEMADPEDSPGKDRPRDFGLVELKKSP